MPEETESKLDRRTALQLLGATTISGLAGCAGDDDDVPEGERVPTIATSYWSDMGETTEIWEASIPIVEDNLEKLGLEMEIIPQDFTSNTEEVLDDSRNYHMCFWGHTPNPDRLDPEELCIRYSAEWAGSDGRANAPNWADCEYTDHAFLQSVSGDEETRRGHVEEAMKRMSEEVPIIPILPLNFYGAYRTDQIEPGGLGEVGIDSINPFPLFESTLLEGDSITFNTQPATLESRNFLITNFSTGVLFWSNLVHSPLVMYNESLDLVDGLAEDWWFEEDGLHLYAELKDAVHHNGDPVTAEDVQFTFAHLGRNVGAFPQAANPPYEEPIEGQGIEIIDDKTVLFRFEEPFPSMTTREWTRWGILHKDTWVEAGAVDDPQGVDPDPLIGSGPFQIDDFTSGNFISLSPHDGNPIAQPNENVVGETHRDITSASRAFREGSLQFVNRLSVPILEDIQDTVDEAEVTTFEGFTPGTMLHPQNSQPPGQFHSFREAIGQAVDRETISQVATGGLNSPQTHGSVMLEPHPFKPPDEELNQLTDDPEGDIEAAREVLEENGWEWDGDDNLHYPPDADMTPPWAEGSVPSSDSGFSCLDEEGIWLHPDER